MFSCDYNGWADVPEDEREAIDVFESAHQLSAPPVPAVLVVEPASLPLAFIPKRRAA